MKSSLGDKTHTGYDQYNVSFIVWLFDVTYHKLIQPSLALVGEADGKDKSTMTKKGQPSK